MLSRRSEGDDERVGLELDMAAGTWGSEAAGMLVSMRVAGMVVSSTSTRGEEAGKGIGE